MSLAVLAPAKVNLALHVTGQRADGYHLLDSLVSFAPFGDRLEIAPAEEISLTVAGPEAAGVPADARNLVWKALAATGLGAARMHLIKHLPAASGIGGGSSDATAAIRGALALAGRSGRLTAGRLRAGALDLDLAALGADLPMCFAPHPARATGIGEHLEAVTLPPLPALLVNPRVEVPTPAVFKALTEKNNPPIEPLPAFADARTCIAWLGTQRNDLEAPAIAAAPVIAELLAALKALPGAGLVRMSGSGATCFALFETLAEARAAEARLAAAHPAWWMASGALANQEEAARPQPL